MSLTAEAVTHILESRYDWHSARVVLRQAAQHAGLDPAGPFDAGQVEALAEALLKIGDRVEGVAAGLRAAAAEAGKGGGSKKEAAPAKAEPAKESADAGKGDAAADDGADEKKGGGRSGGRKK